MEVAPPTLTEEEIREREESERRRRRILEEIEEEGAPAIVRPLIKGRGKVIEPARPGRDKADIPSPKKVVLGKEKADELATLIVHSVKEQVGKEIGRVKGKLAAQIADLARTIEMFATKGGH